MLMKYTRDVMSAFAGLKPVTIELRYGHLYFNPINGDFRQTAGKR